MAQTSRRMFPFNVESASCSVQMGRCVDSKGNVLEPADAVRVDCGGYQHWGVYVDGTVHTTAFDEPVVNHWLERKIAQTAAETGEGNIVHMTANGVIQQNILDVANECPFYRDNTFDKVQRPFMKQGILSLAHTRLGDRSYHFLNNNCENFVNQVRCGNPKSKQVDDYMKHHDIGNFDFVEYGPTGGTRTTYVTTDRGHRSQSSSYSASFSTGEGQGQQSMHAGIGGQGHAHSSVTGQGTASAASSGPGGTITSMSMPGSSVYMTSPQFGPMQSGVPSTGPPGSDIKRDLFCSVCHGSNIA